VLRTGYLTLASAGDYSFLKIGTQPGRLDVCGRHNNQGSTEKDYRSPVAILDSVFFDPYGKRSKYSEDAQWNSLAELFLEARWLAAPVFLSWDSI
jgi:hypothetical protein